MAVLLDCGDYFLFKEEEPDILADFGLAAAKTTRPLKKICVGALFMAALTFMVFPNSSPWGLWVGNNLKGIVSCFAPATKNPLPFRAKMPSPPPQSATPSSHEKTPVSAVMNETKSNQPTPISAFARTDLSGSPKPQGSKVTPDPLDSAFLKGLLKPRIKEGATPISAFARTDLSGSPKTQEPKVTPNPLDSRLRGNDTIDLIPKPKPQTRIAEAAPSIAAKAAPSIAAKAAPSIAAKAAPSIAAKAAPSHVTMPPILSEYMPQKTFDRLSSSQKEIIFKRYSGTLTKPEQARAFTDVAHFLVKPYASLSDLPVDIRESAGDLLSAATAAARQLRLCKAPFAKQSSALLSKMYMSEVYTSGKGQMIDYQRAAFYALLSEDKNCLKMMEEKAPLLLKILRPEVQKYLSQATPLAPAA